MGKSKKKHRMSSKTKQFNIRIRPHKVKVFFSRKALNKHIKHGENLLGLTIADRLEIFINPIGNSMERETLLHEILHMIWYMSGATNQMSHRAEEEIISIITPHLMNFLKDNPHIYRYIINND